MGRFGNFDQLRAGNLLKQCPGLRTNRPGRAAGGRNRERPRGALSGLRSARGDSSARISLMSLHLARSVFAFGIFRIIAEQVAVFLHVGAAAGGVDHNTFHVSFFKYINSFPREFLGLRFFFARVNEHAPQQVCSGGATTSQPSAESTRGGGGIHVREKSALHATEEKPDALALLAPRRGDGCHGLDGRRGWEQRVPGANGFRQQLERADRPQCGLQTTFLVGKQRQAQEFQASRLW